MSRDQHGNKTPSVCLETFKITIFDVQTQLGVVIAPRLLDFKRLLSGAL